MNRIRNLAIVIVALASPSVAQGEQIIVDWSDRAGWRESAPLDDPLFNDGRLVDRSVWFPVQASAEDPPATGGNAWRMAIEFDLTGVSIERIQRAFLSFDTGRTQIGDAPLELHSFFGDGDAQRSDVLIDNLLESFVVSETRDDFVTWNFDVSALVRRTIARDFGHLSFNLRISNDLALGTGNFGTSLYAPLPGTPEYELYRGPQIIITKVPEPGTLALLGIGLFGLGLSRRRLKVSKLFGPEVA